MLPARQGLRPLVLRSCSFPVCRVLSSDAQGHRSPDRPSQRLALTLSHSVLVGGVLGCGVLSPLGSFVGLAASAATGTSGLAGLISGASVGGILGGGIGAGCGLGVALVDARRPEDPHLVVVIPERRRIGWWLFQQCRWEATLDAALNQLPFRGRLLAFIFGLMIGSSGFAGMLLKWHLNAGKATDQEAQSPADDPVLHTGGLQRWVWWSWGWWLPHWQHVQAQLRGGLLVLSHRERGAAATRVSGPAVALPLDGVKVALTSQGRLCLTLASGQREDFKADATEMDEWVSALKGETRQALRTLTVKYPGSWQPPFEALRVVKLNPQDPEYCRVARMAEEQQFKPEPGQERKAYVSGKLKVVGVARVQSPHVWDQYCLRRAIIAAENDGDPNERQLWHGTQKIDVILKHGFDPRVCSLQGMFGGGVYFADLSTKSVRYCGSQKRGQLILCRVSLGNQVLKRMPQPNLRRPPEPLPLFPSHVLDWLRDHHFHSVYCSSAHFPWAVLMNEYVVYHTNQAYPEYLVDFVMK